jgi:hypothetical protein
VPVDSECWHEWRRGTVAQAATAVPAPSQALAAASECRGHSSFPTFKVNRHRRGSPGANFNGDSESDSEYVKQQSARPSPPAGRLQVMFAASNRRPGHA